MPENLRQKILFLCREIEDAIAIDSFIPDNEEQLLNTIITIREELGAA